MTFFFSFPPLVPRQTTSTFAFHAILFLNSMLGHLRPRQRLGGCTPKGKAVHAGVPASGGAEDAAAPHLLDVP